MNTTLAVKITLIPLAAFGMAVGLGQVTAGAVLGTGLAGALVAWRRRTGQAVPQLEVAMALTLAAIAAWCLLAGPPSGFAASAAGFAGLGLGAAWSVARGRPWTADYAQAEYAGTEHDPLFVRINRALSALWAEDGQTVGQIGTALTLDSNTLTPLLKRLEQAGWVRRQRDAADERQVRLWLTVAGQALRDKAAAVPPCFLDRTGLDRDQAAALRDEVAALRDRLRPR